MITKKTDPNPQKNRWGTILLNKILSSDTPHPYPSTWKCVLHPFPYLPLTFPKCEYH